MTAMNLSLREVAESLTGARPVGDGATLCVRVHSDTRSLQPGDLFVALKGERFDAASFLPDAAAKGAVAALCDASAAAQLTASGLPGVLVPDAKIGLGELARQWRRRFAGPLIAVTGSNGKTTVTQMIAAILRAWQGDAALATEGNFNNDIGLPPPAAPSPCCATPRPSRRWPPAGCRAFWCPTPASPWASWLRPGASASPAR